MINLKLKTQARTALLLAITSLIAGSASGQVISSVAATSVTDSSAVITWTTDIASSSLVNYGVTASPSSASPSNPALVTAHSVILSGLSANTLYNFNVVSSAGTHTTTSAGFRFATLSISPIISDLNVINLSSTSASINWTTDQASSGRVNYGITTNYGSATPVDSAPTIAHSLTLSGLTPDTTYNFAVVSAVGSNGVPSTSTNQTFTTAPSGATAPNVSFVASYGMTNSGAIVSWSTDVPANTMLAYGTTTALGQLTPLQSTLSASHGVTLTSLDPGTTYYFVAISTGADGATGYSPVYSLTTTGLPPTAPLISQVTSSNLTTTSATITWTTDVPSNSLVNYGTSTSYGHSMLGSTLTRTHSITLTGLAPGTSYDFQVVSANPAGVSTFGADLNGFTIWAWGDSQTLGGTDGSRINYPSALSIDLGGVTVNNEGVGGNTSTQIAQRMLATPASFTSGNCHVIWSGANNPTETSQILSDVASMIAALDAPPCFLVMGVINQVVSPLGSSIYNSIIQTNESLASIYGNNYLDIRELVVQAYNPSLPLDVADHENDIPPSSLRAVVSLGTITSGALNNQSCTFSVSNGTQGPGTVIIIDAETILITAVNGNQVTGCVRGYNTTAAASHAANATYSKIDDTHLGFNGLEFVASQVASWFHSQPWPLCGGTSICPFPANFTTAAIELPAPVISAVTASNITSTSAVLSWTTDQPSSSVVNYGPTTSYGSSSTPGATLTTIHVVTLTGLTPSRTYDFDVVSANSAGKASTSANSTFSTAAAAPLTISNVGATNLTSTSATISWTTSQAATAQVNYGTTTNHGTLSPATTTLTTSQSITLSGLSPSTTYDYQVISTTSFGLAATSANFTFTTPAAAAKPPSVGYVAFWGVNNNGVTISWSTDVNANTVVAYGTTPALGQVYTNTSATATASHGAVLTGLLPGTTYYFVAQSTGANGATGYSSTYTFTTTGTAPTNASFTLSATAVSAIAGSTAASTVTVSPVNGFNSGVTLATSGWPSGFSGTFATNPAGTSSVVNISIAASVAPGPYSLAVNGISGSLSASTTITLTVTAVNGPASFSLSATAAAVNVGSTGSSTISIIRANGFSSAVTLSASGWPAGITGTFATNPATSSSSVSISVAATVSAGPYTLTIKGVSSTLTETTNIALTVNPLSSSANSASFTGFDTSTQGAWTGKYGSDGFQIANDGSNLPAYADLGFSGDLTYTWAGLTSDVRALQSYQGATARIASCYYINQGNFTISLDLNDGALHQVAIYLLDWDTTTRAETITITDAASGSVLDSRSITSFHNGVYAVWNLKGNLSIKVSEAGGNPVVSGIFFAPAGAVSITPGFTLSSTAASAIQGATATSTVTVIPSNGFNSPVTLAASGWPTGITGTFAPDPATATAKLNISVAAGVASGPYSLTVTGASGNLSATTIIPLTVTPAGLSSSAAYLGLDTTTQGAWTGKHGSAGHLIADISGVSPTSATVTVAGALTYVWAQQTTDVRALQSVAGSTTGIASAYTTQYAGQQFTINIDIIPGSTQKVSLYLLDWDSSARNETITIMDALTGTVLDTETFAGFHNGQYASWNMTGNVMIKVTPNGVSSPVVSGIFFN